MQMVAASKLKGAQAKVEHSRPYALALKEVIDRLSLYGTDPYDSEERPLHPLLGVPKEESKKLFVVIASDRGLCGAFNANLLRFAHAQMGGEQIKDQGVQVYAVGKKVLESFNRLGVPVSKHYLGITASPSYALAQSIADEVIELFTSGQFFRVELIFSRFRSVSSYVPTRVCLLPVGRFKDGEPKDTLSLKLPEWSYLFEPSREKILGSLLPRYATVIIYQSLLESSASEHAARMMAMENASKNAKEMIERFTLLFNKTRQAVITKELTEIVGGKEALEG
jgi:F-type H+-transporting ATPase subunit gamma